LLARRMLVPFGHDIRFDGALLNANSGNAVVKLPDSFDGRGARGTHQKRGKRWRPAAGALAEYAL
jgi:hypothetical protein